MAQQALRYSGIVSQLSLLRNDPTQMRSRGFSAFPQWTLNGQHRQYLVSKCKAQHWEIGSSNINAKNPPEANVDGKPILFQTALEEEDNVTDVMDSNGKHSEILMFSIAPLPYLILAALPGDLGENPFFSVVVDYVLNIRGTRGLHWLLFVLLSENPVAEIIRSVFGPFAELVKTWNLPDWLVHWGHPGNMAVVLFAMGGYGSYLGWQIRLSDDVEVKAKAKDLHPKLLGGMFFFFALGATGGITSLLTSDKPILESPHAVTGLIGLALLTLQTALPALFEGNPGLRNVHGLLGSGIMALFLIHSALGLQLGLSF
eukprot:Gb_18320 [translate_table: standard]